MYPLVDKPVVVVYKGKKRDGTNDIRVATNIAPETKVILCETTDDFLEHSLGKPFVNNGN